MDSTACQYRLFAATICNLNFLSHIHYPSIFTVSYAFYWSNQHTVYQIIIQNPTSNTVIHNVHPDELHFWQNLLSESNIRGDVQIIDRPLI